MYVPSSVSFWLTIPSEVFTIEKASPIFNNNCNNDASVFCRVVMKYFSSPGSVCYITVDLTPTVMLTPSTPVSRQRAGTFSAGSLIS